METALPAAGCPSPAITCMASCAVGTACGQPSRSPRCPHSHGHGPVSTSSPRRIHAGSPRPFPTTIASPERVERSFIRLKRIDQAGAVRAFSASRERSLKPWIRLPHRSMKSPDPVDRSLRGSGASIHRLSIDLIDHQDRVDSGRTAPSDESSDPRPRSRPSLLYTRTRARDGSTGATPAARPPCGERRRRRPGPLPPCRWSG